MDQYVSVLYEIVTRRLTTHSYKFALRRALARLAPATDERSPKIFKRDLSPLFLEYYWPLEAKYHIRQGIDPDKDPIVMKLIRHLVYADVIVREKLSWTSKVERLISTPRCLLALNGKPSVMSSLGSIPCATHQ